MARLRLPCHLGALLLLGLVPVARGQRAEELVRWEGRVAPVAAGRSATLHLTATVAPTWKLYALDSPPPAPALRVTPTLPAGVAMTAGSARHPLPPKTVYDPNFETDVRSFEGRVAVDVPLQVGAGVAAGTYRVGASVRFAICDPSICLPPKTVTVEADLRVTRPAASRSEATPSTGSAAPPREPVAESPLPAPLPTPPAPDDAALPAAAPGAPTGSGAASAPAGGLGWGFLLLALGAGLGALLTPCVFPMVPLTVSYFGRHTATRGAALRMAGLYALAIVGTYTALGLGLAALVGASGAGALAAHPVVNLLIGLAFVGFGLSLLGLFELRLPAAWVNRVNRAGTTSAGAGGALLMGLTLTLVAFSCTVPFVGGLLAVAAQGSWLRPVVGMLVFSVAFAAPFFLFALFPRLLARLPRSGSWMETLKVTLGFVELAAALKFLGQADVLWGAGIVTRPVAIALSAALFGVAGLYLLGLLRFHTDAPGAPIGAGRVVGAVGFLGTALYLVPGLWGASLGLADAFLPPRRATEFALTAGAAPAAEADWHVGEAGWATARAAALTSARPVFVDFSGYACTNCRYMEANVFPDPAVAGRLARMERVRVYTDDLAEGEALQRAQLRLTGTVALPTYAVLAPDGRLLAQHSGTASAERFARFLDAAGPLPATSAGATTAP